MLPVKLSSHIPGPPVSKDGVEDGQELPHAGDARDFGRSPGLGKALVEDTDDRVPPGGADGGHEEGVPNRRATPHDHAPAAHRTAVAIDGRDPSQGCCVLGMARASGRTRSANKAMTSAPGSSTAALKPISFGEPTYGACKGPNLARIDDGEP